MSSDLIVALLRRQLHASALCFKTSTSTLRSTTAAPSKPAVSSSSAVSTSFDVSVVHNVWLTALLHAHTSLLPSHSLDRSIPLFAAYVAGSFDAAPTTKTASLPTINSPHDGQVDIHAVSTYQPSPLLTQGLKARRDATIPIRRMMAADLIGRVRSSQGIIQQQGGSGGGNLFCDSSIDDDVSLQVLEHYGRYEPQDACTLDLLHVWLSRAAIGGITSTYHTHPSIHEVQWVLLMLLLNITDAVGNHTNVATSATGKQAATDPTPQLLQKLACVHAAHAMALAPHVSTIRRTAAAESLRLWCLYRSELEVNTRGRQSLPQQRLHDDGEFQWIGLRLYDRVLEYLAEGVESHTTSDGLLLRPSMWDTLSILCMSVPWILLMRQLQHEGGTYHIVEKTRHVLAWWKRELYKAATTFSGCIKAMELCTETLRLLPARHDASATSTTAIVGQAFASRAGRAALHALRFPTHHRAFSSCANALLIATSTAPMNVPIVCHTWVSLHMTLVSYRYHTTQTDLQRCARMDMILRSVAHLPLTQTLPAKEWAAVTHTCRVCAAVSPLASCAMVRKVLRLLRTAYERTATFHALSDALHLLLPVVPVRQWLPLVMAMELAPWRIVSRDDCGRLVPLGEWDSIVSVMAVALHEEMPLDEILPSMSWFQGHTARKESHLLYAAPLVALLVLEQCAHLAVRSTFRTAERRRLLSVVEQLERVMSTSGCTLRAELLDRTMRTLTDALAHKEAPEGATVPRNDAHHTTQEVGRKISSINRSTLQPAKTPPSISLLHPAPLYTMILGICQHVFLPSPHRLRQVLGWLFGPYGATTVPLLQAGQDLFGSVANSTPVSADQPSLSLAPVVHNPTAMRRVYHLWAGTVAASIDAMAVTRQHGQEETCNTNNRWERLMLCENSVSTSNHRESCVVYEHDSRVLIVRGSLSMSSTASTTECSGSLPSPKQQFLPRLRSALLDVAHCGVGSWDIHMLRQLVAEEPCTRAIIRLCFRRLPHAEQSASQDALVELLHDDVVDGHTAVACSFRDATLEQTLSGTTAGQRVTTMLRFCRALQIVLDDSTSSESEINEAYEDILSLFEEQHSAPSLLSGLVLQWTDIPQSVHMRYFLNIRRSSDWRKGVDVLRRWEALQVPSPTVVHNEPVPSSHLNMYSLPSATIGCIAVACFACGVALPTDIALRYRQPTQHT